MRLLAIPRAAIGRAKRRNRSHELIERRVLLGIAARSSAFSCCDADIPCSFVELSLLESIPFNTTRPPNLGDGVLIHEAKLSRFAKEPKPDFLPRNENRTFPSAALILLSVAVLCHGTRTALFLDGKKLKNSFYRATARNPPLQNRSRIPDTCGINSPHGLRRQNSGACAFLDLTLVAAGRVRSQQTPQPIPRLPVRRPIHLYP